MNTTQSSSDPFDLNRFVRAQQQLYADALEEIRNGRKRSHWMWFIFPQYHGLGTSALSQLYAIKSLEEARAYLAHPVLGPRLIECAEAALAVAGKSAQAIFGSPDDKKLQSSATLFACVTQENSVFAQLLTKFYQSQRDPQTLQLLGFHAQQ